MSFHRLCCSEILLSTRKGFDLINLLTGFTHAIIIDCSRPHPPSRRLSLFCLENCFICRTPELNRVSVN